MNAQVSPRDINESLITLIPKIKHPRRLSDFRPISLCNVSYKLISKALVNRMKFISNDVIFPYQSAFIPGRCVVDNAIIGFECIHSLKKKTSGKVG